MRGGISHNEIENATIEDCSAGANVLLYYFRCDGATLIACHQIAISANIFYAQHI